MSNQISTQVSKLSKILADPGTVGTYQQTIAVTVNILKETAVLVWLVLCLSLVAIDWLWDNSIKTGQSARTWLSNLQTVESNEIPSQVGQGVMSAGKSGLSYVVAQAREQIGLPAKPEEVAEAPEVAKPEIAKTEITKTEITKTEPVKAAPQPATPDEA